jgi:hypothetical protein
MTNHVNTITGIARRGPFFCPNSSGTHLTMEPWCHATLLKAATSLPWTIAAHCGRMKHSATGSADYPRSVQIREIANYLVEIPRLEPVHRARAEYPKHFCFKIER